MKYGLIGKHLSHSFSKPIHESFNYYKYDLKEIKENEIDDFFKDKEFNAINVTIPYKEVAYRACDVLDDQAKSIGACNCVVNIDGKLYGHNTDYDGIKHIFIYRNIDLKNKKALILGKGGASKAFETVLKEQGIKDVQIVYYKNFDGCITYEDVYRDYLNVDILINATPVGMSPNIYESPIDLSKFTSLEFVFDAIYNPLETKLLSQAKELNIKCINGLLMLVTQAKYAAEYFINEKFVANITNISRQLTLASMNIVFIGMPSCGKTTISKIVAKKLNKPCIDIDEKIVEKAGMPISSIFEKYGEKCFRDMETELTKEISKQTNTVISCGGGIILNKENIDALKQNGIIIYLDRPLPLLISEDSSRPKLKEGIENLYKQRKELYEKYADIHINNDSTIESTINEILNQIINKKNRFI